MSQAVAAPPTDKVGEFLLLKSLGKGGMGEVWLAQAPDGKHCVIKRLLDSASQNESFLKRFRNEGRYASLLHHPHVVGVLEVGEAGGLPYLVLEYVDGTDLRKVKKGARARGELLPPGAVVDAILQACRGLHAAHELCDPETGKPLNLMHRDVSPDNLLLDRTGHVKVSDFGIARADGQALTSNGALWGKHSYMAPERLQGKDADRRVDVFSLGVVLFELLALERPFSSKAQGGAIAAVLFEKPRALGRLVPDLPEALIAVVERMLEKDPDQRFASCAAVADALETVLAQAPMAGTSADLLAFATQARADFEDASNNEPATRAARKSRAIQNPDALPRHEEVGSGAEDERQVEGTRPQASFEEGGEETREHATEAAARRRMEAAATAPLPRRAVKEALAAKEASAAKAAPRAEPKQAVAPAPLQAVPPKAPAQGPPWIAIAAAVAAALGGAWWLLS